MSSEATATPSAVSRGDYHLPAEQLDALEASIVASVRDAIHDQSSVAVLLVSGEDEFAAFGRTSETLGFSFEDYDFAEGMARYEETSQFLLTLDLDTARVAHVKRIVTPLPPFTEGETGIEVLDDRAIAADVRERARLADLLALHGIGDLSRCITVATNLNTKRGVRDFLAKPYVLVSYKAVFLIADSAGVTHGFAYMNQRAIESLNGGLGFSFSLLGDREYHLPIAGKPGSYDQDYVAVCFPNSPENQRAFREAAPEYPGRALIADREVPVLARRTGGALALAC